MLKLFGTPKFHRDCKRTSLDGFFGYTWDAEGKVVTVNGVTSTYDALGRRVEQYAGGTYTQIVFDPLGFRRANMNGPNLIRGFQPLPGQALAFYDGAGLSMYRHADWLGSTRIASTPSRTVFGDGAFSPFGAVYGTSGSFVGNFIGQRQIQAPTLWDFAYREYQSGQARWVSPDPAGLGAVDITNPQSWNQYAYVMGNPTGMVDPLGLEGCEVADGCFTVTGTAPGPGPTPPVTIQPWLTVTNYMCYVFHLFCAPVTAPPPGTGGGGRGGAPGPIAAKNKKRPEWLNTITSIFGYNEDIPLRSCFGGFVNDTLTNLNPVSPSLGSFGPSVGAAYGAVKFKQAVEYAASTPSRTFGTSFLLYPNKSSVFRSLLQQSARVGKITAAATVVLAEAQAFWDEIKALKRGGCQ